VLRAIYADELKRLDGYARETPLRMSRLHAVRGMSAPGEEPADSALCAVTSPG
jgi:hypothetical protein